MHDDDDPLDDGEVVRNCSSTTLETYVGFVEVSYLKKQLQTSWDTHKLHIVQAYKRIDYAQKHV